MKNRYKTVLLTALFIIVGLSVPVFAVEGGALFSSDSILKITLACNFKIFQKDIKEKRTTHTAQFTYKHGENKELSFPVKIKTRGHFRRNPRVCDSPPISIRFTKETTKDSLFFDQNKLKLVTHCKKNLKVFNEYVVREYLVYRLYNTLTDISFRARLVEVTYKDTGHKGKTLTRYGILIENEKKMAARLKGKVIENRWGYGLLTRIDNSVRLLHAIFQFMVGHTDWSVPAGHNVKLVEFAGKQVIPVPYDFDLTGVVNAHYARPDPKVAGKIKSVRDRLYRGFCMPLSEFNKVFEIFEQKKETIYALLEKPFLSSKSRKSTKKFLDKFYKIIAKPRQVQKHFIDNCRKKMR